MRNWIKHALSIGCAQLRVPISSRLAKLSDVFELAGIGCLVVAAFMFTSIVGMLALGAALIYLGWVTHESQ